MYYLIGITLFILLFVKDNEVLCEHEYGTPIESVQKCLNVTKAKRYPREDESFVKFQCLPLGFGNRLYVYIAARAAAERFNKTFLHVRHPDAAVLLALNFDPYCTENFSDEVILDGIKFQEHKSSWLEYHEHILDSKTSYEVGSYMQSYKFSDFPGVREKIWKGLEFKQSKITDDADHCIMKYKSRLTYSAPLVCVHIRLGDKFKSYRNPDESVRYDDQALYAHWVPNADYMRVGIEWFDKNLTKAHYLVFSDSITRVRKWNLQQYTRNSITLLDDLHCQYSSPLSELSMLLDHCDHLFLSAGTFGMCAGWRSKGHVLVSKLQFVALRLNKTFISAKDELDHFPPNVHLVHPCEGDIDKFCEVSESRDPHWNDWKANLRPGRNISIFSRN